MGKHTGKQKKKNTRGKKKKEKENRNIDDLHRRQQAKDTVGKNFLGKANTEAQYPSLNKKMKDEETSPKETKDDNVLVEEDKDHYDVLSDDNTIEEDVLSDDNTRFDHLDQEKDKIHQVIIGSFVDYLEENGFTNLARMLEKESGYFNTRHFEDLVQCSRWKSVEDYLSHFFDIGESALLSKIKTLANMDDLKRQGLPLPEPNWLDPDEEKVFIIAELPKLIRGKLKTRDELKLPQESILWSHFTSQLTCEGSDLVGVHRRPPGERKDEYKKFAKMTIFHKILEEGKGTKLREGVYENKPATIKCIDLNGEVPINKRERSILWELEGHENVVKYYGVESDEDSSFIALEKCSFSLHDLFDKEKNYGIEIKSTWDPTYHPGTMMLSLIKDIIMGLDYLHSHDFIHRGLNPSNIMIKQECGKFCAKLSNMGFSKRLSGASSTTNTPTNPAKSLIDNNDAKWKAPEQKEKGKKVGRYVDFYSLGLIIHFCLTEGKHPWDVNPKKNMKSCSIKQQLSMLVKKFPEAYDILSQLMSPEKNKRPNAKQVLKHPFFWDSPKRNDFMRHASDWLGKQRENSKNSNTKSPILAKLESMKGYIFTNRWDDKIDAEFVRYLQGNDLHMKFDNVFDLVRVIRNKSGHFLELPEKVKDLIPGQSADGFEEYFVRRFPNLLLEVYKVVLEFWKDEPTFRRYFA